MRLLNYIFMGFLSLTSSIIFAAGQEATQAEFANLINQARINVGVGELFNKNELICTAQNHAQDIGSKHLCQVNPSDGSTPWDVAAKCGTVATGIVIGCGYQNAITTVQGWLGRQDTKDVLLNPAYKYFGVGMVNNFWVIYLGW